MKKLFFILILIVFYPNFSLRAACPENYPTPKIEFYTSYGKLQYDFTKSIEEITSMTKKTELKEKGLFASGLTAIKINMDISLNSTVKQLNKKTYCIYPKDVKLSIYYKDPTIYIANSLKPNTCEYNVVLRHEQAHVQINKTALDYFIPLFHKAAIEIFKSIKTREVNSKLQTKQASQEIAEEFDLKFTPIYNYFKQQIFTEQQKLDNDNNYKYESSICR